MEKGEDRWREERESTEEDETKKQKVYPDSFYFWRNKRQDMCYDAAVASDEARNRHPALFLLDDTRNALFSAMRHQKI